MGMELKTLNQDTISKLVLSGDMKGLTDAQKVDYYAYRCQQAGLDPAAKPFDILTLNGKMILYANASSSQQLTSIHKLSYAITGRELVDDIYTVFCRVSGPDGRSTENMGAVPLGGLKGDAKANAMLKATTKAIRRAVLAHCGLGMMDESEVETIPGAKIGAEYAWSIDEIEELEVNLERVYTALKTGGKESEYGRISNKWKSRKDEPAEKVLTEMATYLNMLEEAVKRTLEQSEELKRDWTDEERSEAKQNLYTFMETLLSSGVPEDAINAIKEDYRLKIGDPETSPEQWSNRLWGACERATAKAKR